MNPRAMLADGLAVILTVGCGSVRESTSGSAVPVSSAPTQPTTRADAERIAMGQFRDVTRVRIVYASLEDGVWYVLVARLPETPGAHTTFKIRAQDGVIIGTIPGA